LPAGPNAHDGRPAGRPRNGGDVFESRMYVRKSQSAKFKPHAAEVRRLNEEGIKFLEEYFDYKFPFPKYDIVLVPEFPFGGMEHAGVTFFREDRIIFPQEPTGNDQISRANLIFHEAAHQWFGDTVTMRWFDDLWLKEGFAEFMAYKTLGKVLPEYNAWKVFYERNKQAAYLTDSTRGTTPIYQEINNLSAAKSAYGNIVYRKAPSFLKQAEYFIGPESFQTAVREFLKKHEFSNASWGDLVTEFEAASGRPLGHWAKQWVTQPGLPIIRSRRVAGNGVEIMAADALGLGHLWEQKFETVSHAADGSQTASVVGLNVTDGKMFSSVNAGGAERNEQLYFFPNRNDYGYGVFLLDDESRDFILNNIQYEKDEFLRTMLWGSLWDSVREAELDPKQYVELVVKVLGADLGRPTVSNEPANRTLPRVRETESTIQTLLGRVSTAMRYYVSDEQRAELAPKVEALLIEKMQNAKTPGQRITYYRAFLGIASTSNARRILKEILQNVSPSSAKSEGGRPAAAGPSLASRTKDRFDIVSRLIILGDPDAEELLTSLEATETSDEAKRYAYAARAGVATPETKARYWNDFTTNKDISESWIEAAFVPFNSVRQSDLTLPYLEKALAELPKLKRDRKIFFVNGWLGAFIGGHKSEEALAIVNKFLADTPSLDNDLRLKILENVDTVERAVKIRHAFGR